MITKYDIIHSLKKAKDDPEMKFTLDDKHENIIEKETGKVLFSIDEGMEYFRKKFHCNFEVIYYEHGLLEITYRCKECGTVIFASEDENYDPKLACPTCGGYKTHFEYWTKEQIDSDEKKQNTVKMFHEMMHEKEEAAKRREKRGLCDWEIWKKDIKFKNSKITLSLECLNLFHTKLKGLNLYITKWVKEDNGYIGKKFTRIPLSPYAFYIQCIVSYKKDTHPSIRKYYPWQKKPDKTKKQ